MPPPRYAVLGYLLVAGPLLEAGIGASMTNSTPVLPIAAAPHTLWQRLASIPELSIPELWKRSLIAVLGLGLAFATAIFSTVMRDSGNVLGTAVLAGASLLLAVWVGIATVPYLAGRVVSGGRWQDAFDFEVTRAGMVYVLTTLLIGVAALNTGNNLLYLIVSAMLAAILISGVCSSLVLSDLELEVTLPHHVFAGEKVRGWVVVSKRRKGLPSLSVTVAPPKPGKQRDRWRAVRGEFAFPLNRPAGKEWLRLKDLKIRRIPAAPRLPAVFDGSLYFAMVPAGSSVRGELDLRFARRGLYRQDAFTLATGFPFGLLIKRRRIELSRDVVVYPALDRTTNCSGIFPQFAGDQESARVGVGQDLVRIRAYIPGDSARHVDWKATAKSGSLKVREFSRDEEKRFRIIFDNPAPGQISVAAYERGIQAAASLAWQLAEQSADVTFTAPGLHDSEEIHEFLSYLAVAQPGLGQDLLARLGNFGGQNLLFTARQQNSIPKALSQASQLYDLRAAM